MDSWVNPALTAAIVSALVTGAGWFVSIWQNRNNDKIRRAEKVRDVTIAIAAEITHNIDRFSYPELDIDAHCRDIVARITQDHGFTPLVPRYRPVLVFEQIIGTIEILPHDIIGPALAYYKSEYALQLFVEDLRSDAYKQRDASTKARMYEDYIVMIKDAIDKGNIAHQSVKRYLEERYEITLAGQHKAPIADSNRKTKINNPDEDQSF